MSTSTRSRRLMPMLGVVALTAVLVTACATGPTASTGTTGSAPNTTSAPPVPDHDGMPGMDMPTGDGLTAESSGFRFVPTATSLGTGLAAPFTFRITDTGGKAVTAFEPDQTKLMHFYLIRSDLTGFQHVHPTLSAEGTWTAPLAALGPGSYRAYASFTARDSTGKPVPLVLSQPLTAPGAATTTPLAPASTTTRVDGYTLTLAGDRVRAGVSQDLTLTVSRNGEPVNDLQPYLDTYAHLSAFHSGDLGFAHLHPHGTVHGDHGGPALTFEAMLPKPGPWRLFLQFQTGGALHTAAVTITAG